MHKVIEAQLFIQHGGLVTIDMIFSRIRRGHADLIAMAKQGIPWSALHEDTRYHLVHNQLACITNGVHPPILALLQGMETEVLTGLIGHMNHPY